MYLFLCCSYLILIFATKHNNNQLFLFILCIDLFKGWVVVKNKVNRLNNFQNLAHL